MEGYERENYSEIETYLTHSEYPEGAIKAKKGSIRKRAKKFRKVDRLLRYTGGKDGVLRQVYRKTFACTCTLKQGAQSRKSPKHILTYSLSSLLGNY